MEELREAAVAYYYNGPPDVQELGRTFFREMDTDGNGKISSSEFQAFLQQTGYNWYIQPNLFVDLDRNGDGSLDFFEFLTFFYVVKARLLSCTKCGAFLKGLYFTCVTCFEYAESTYDLCPPCYRSRTLRDHPHSVFLDNYVMLRSRRQHPLQPQPQPQPQPQHQPQPLALALAPGQANPAWNRLWAAFQGFNSGLQAWSLATTFCSIM